MASVSTPASVNCLSAARCHRIHPQLFLQILGVDHRLRDQVGEQLPSAGLAAEAAESFAGALLLIGKVIDELLPRDRCVDKYTSKVRAHQIAARGP